MENERLNFVKQIIKPLNFNRMRQRMQVVDFVPFYGMFSHAERCERNSDYTFIDCLDDGVVLGLYNSPFVFAGLYITDKILHL